MLARTSRFSLSLTLLVGSLSCFGSGGGSSGGLVVLGSNVSAGQVFPINGIIELTFNKPIKLSSANFSSFSIVPLPPATAGAPVAGPVQGSFYLKPGSNDLTLAFQPSCPTDPLNQTGGLLGGNIFGPVLYNLTLPVASPGQTQVLQATDGSLLGQAFSITFQTPAPPASPLLDPVPGSPPTVIETQNLPALFGLNLLVNPNPPITVVINQPVKASSINDDSIRLEFIHPITSNTIRIPASVTLAANCTEDGLAILTVAAKGVMPAGQNVFLTMHGVEGFGDNDINPTDIQFHSAPVANVAGTPQRDAMLEEFDTTLQLDPAAPLVVPFATWSGGTLQAAPIYPGTDNNIEIEIGPGTANGSNVVFSTDGGQLTDKVSGSKITFANGVIDVAKFTIKGTTSGNPTIFTGVGSNPLIIRCSKTFTVQANAELRVNGNNGVDINGLCTAIGFFGGATGNCGGGNGGTGSPDINVSSPKGGDGFGPFQTPGIGGRGGNSGYGFASANCGSAPGQFSKMRCGGGGGGNWGVKEFLSGQYVTVCYSTLSAGTPCFSTSAPFCQYPLNACSAATFVSACAGITSPNNSWGEQGAIGVAGAIDAITNQIPPVGGAPGDAVFADDADNNNFFGRKPTGTATPGIFATIQGELNTILGGQGGGGGGDVSGVTVFPSSQINQTDMSGAPGGGGGGVLWVQSLGKIEVKGKILANGGLGGQGEIIFGPAGNAPGGGGGGAGGMIVLESPTQIEIGASAAIQARGGNRGLGSGIMANPPTFPGGCTGQNNCRKNCSATRGGAGGMGVIQLHVPFTTGSTVACDEVAGNEPQIQANALIVEGVGSITCERDANLISKFTPSPHVLVPNFGPASAVRSQFFYTGQADLVGPPQFEFSGIDGSGFVNSSFSQTLVSGASGTINSASSVTLSSQTLADLVRSEPKVLIADGFQATSGGAVFPIVNASVSGNNVTLSLNPNSGPVASVGSWQVLRRYFLTLSDGTVAPFADSSTAKITFEGADESSPGSMSPINIVSSNNIATVAGKKMLRWTVEFDQNALAATLTPSLPRPGVEFVKIPYGF